MAHWRIVRAILEAVAVILAAAVPPAYAQFKVIYNFGTGPTDPCQPQNSGIIAQGRDGNLYSTANSCGTKDSGAMFKITPTGTFSVPHNFSGAGADRPHSGLTLGTDGDFYGTTASGASFGNIFKITPGGTPSVLHSFTGLSDGDDSNAPPILGTDGNFYGTALRGGNYTACTTIGCGTLYKMTPLGTVTSLYEFDITHGAGPYAPLVQGTDGNFYGTTQLGGTHGGLSKGGVVFKITPAGMLTVLHNFCSMPACADGEYPEGPLIQATDGNFYGTTVNGGANGVGEVFKITPSGTLTVLHSMKSAKDGETPYAGLVQASDGNFYGVNANGGSHSDGTIFELTPKGVFMALYNFDGTTGVNPYVTLVQHTNGILYGDAYAGGIGSEVNCSKGKCGVFYSLDENLPEFINLLPYSGKVGSKIGILGQGFSGASVVKFNGVTATAALTGTTFLLATVPAGASDGFVTVTTGTPTLKSLRPFIVHNSWRSGKPIPTPVNYPAGTGAIGSKIYVVGGGTASGNITTNQVYNTANNTWSTAAALPAATAGGSAAVVNNILYIFGGYSGSVSGTAVNAVWAYNPATNNWAAKKAMPTARGSTAAVVDGTKVYVIGGNGSTLRLDTVEAYDTAADSWTTEAVLLAGKSEPTAGLLGITVVSADGTTTAGPSGDTEAYDVATNRWSGLTADATARNAACYGAVSGLLYVAGGHTGAGAVSLTESFNLAANKWTSQASLPQAMIAPGSAVVAGQLYCISGSSSDLIGQGTLYNNVQIYQP